MKIPFTKLQGASNDFLLTRLGDAPPDNARWPGIAVAICNRYLRAGADGWMIVDSAPGDEFDASIRLFSSDGSQPELAGNGTRCAAALLARDMPRKNYFRIRTGAGIKHLRLISAEQFAYMFEMNMGAVRIDEL